MKLDTLTAYKLIREERIEDVQSNGYYLRHKKSGAKVLLLENEDENKVFNIAFRTTPHDSTGVAHIMEHTVLCGSRKFPSKDPFVELVKGSMNTFLNAMTYPDKTMFPVASCNDKDFANLMDVYLDAVFFPNIYKKEAIFRQEGWHYDISSPDDDIEYNGVVYNEMKGAYSSPDDVLEREIMGSLFPDTVYHHESGGDPECIPDLTYEDYLDFHRTYYHPCNSYIYLYGKMDFEERLNWLDEEYLSKFDPCDVASKIELQPAFDKMRVLEKTFPITQDESVEDNTYLAYNLAIGTSLDTKLATALAVLEYVLLSAPGAPLKQALLDAKIGKDIMSSYDSGIYQPVFSIIAKYANGEDQEAFLQVIRDTLTEIAEKGVDEKSIRAAINIMDFRFREADYGVYPKGLMYGIDAFDSWLYNDDAPFDYLKQLQDFAWLKEQIGTGYFEQVIREHLLANTHATLLVVRPEHGLTAKADQKVREKLDALKASLTKEEIDALIAKREDLRAFQETPSTQEELETIPMLSREDMKKEAEPFRTEEMACDGTWILHHAYQTNGIAYLRLLFDASCVSQEDLPYLGILKCLLGSVNTEHYGYSELNNEINMNTGGISFGITQFPDAFDSKKLRMALGATVRTLNEQISYSFDIVKEILFTSDLAGEKRLLEILRKQKSRLVTGLTGSGSATALCRCMSYFSVSHMVSEGIGGIDYYETVKAIEADFDNRKGGLIKKLQKILSDILSAGRFVVSYTGDEEHLDLVKKEAEALVKEAKKRLGSTAVCAGSAKEMLTVYPEVTLTKKNEGYKTSGKVQYVAKCGSYTDKGYSYSGVFAVLQTIMSYEYLWSNIRVIGGAYGCNGVFTRQGICFTSYRDPQLTKTLNVYDGVPAYLENFTVDERDMTKYVIGTISRLDTPLNPSALGSRSLSAYMNGLTTQDAQRTRDEVLTATQEKVREVAPIVQAALDQDCICVLGEEERIEKHKDLFGEVHTLS